VTPDAEQALAGRLQRVKGSVVGVGVTAFPRSGPAEWLPGYRIACVRRTGDLSALRRTTEIFCLEERLGRPLQEARDSAALLSHPATRRYLGGLPRPVRLLLYQSSFEIERLAAAEGWRLLANPAALRVRASDRAFFQRLAASQGLPSVPGCIVSLGRFQERPYASWAREMGPRLAVQLPDVLQGGGRSTFFLENAEDHRRLLERIRSGAWMGCRLRRVSVHTLVPGEPSSVTGCVLGGRTRLAPLQRQVIDPPWIAGIESSGVFGGHSWGGERWSEPVEAEARRQALAVGRVLTSMGYRGVFGLDLLVDHARGRVIPVELNPRLTGAFPVLTQVQAARGEIPLELLHLLSFLDPSGAGEAVPGQETGSGPLRGGHLVLFRGPGGLPPGPLPAGLYERGDTSETLRRVGEGADLREIHGADQVILCDGPPLERDPSSRGPELDPLERVGRLLFPGPVLAPDGAFRPGVLDLVRRVLNNPLAL
jgi:hypothetical protein